MSYEIIQQKDALELHRFIPIITPNVMTHGIHFTHEVTRIFLKLTNSFGNNLASRVNFF